MSSPSCGRDRRDQLLDPTVAREAAVVEHDPAVAAPSPSASWIRSRPCAPAARPALGAVHARSAASARPSATAMTSAYGSLTVTTRVARRAQSPLDPAEEPARGPRQAGEVRGIDVDVAGVVDDRRMRRAAEGEPDRDPHVGHGVDEVGLGRDGDRPNPLGPDRQRDRGKPADGGDATSDAAARGTSRRSAAPRTRPRRRRSRSTRRGQRAEWRGHPARADAAARAARRGPRPAREGSGSPGASSSAASPSPARARIVTLVAPRREGARDPLGPRVERPGRRQDEERALDDRLGLDRPDALTGGLRPRPPGRRTARPAGSPRSPSSSARGPRSGSARRSCLAPPAGDARGSAASPPPPTSTSDGSQSRRAARPGRRARSGASRGSRSTTTGTPAARDSKSLFGVDSRWFSVDRLDRHDADVGGGDPRQQLVRPARQPGRGAGRRTAAPRPSGASIAFWDP